MRIDLSEVRNSQPGKIWEKGILSTNPIKLQSPQRRIKQGSAGWLVWTGEGAPAAVGGRAVAG